MVNRHPKTGTTGVNMTDKFVYVYTEKSRDLLLKSGGELVWRDDRNGVYAFLLETVPQSALDQVSYLTGNSIAL